jgi:hypothetical protein
MSREIQRPGHDEYVEFMEEEFRFLEKDYGFIKAWDKDDGFRVVYSGGKIRVHIWGWGYGESGHLSVNLGEEELPYSELVTSFQTNLTESTGKPQLDDLREHAYRLKNECAELLDGNLSVLIPYRPFPNAEELWFKREFSTIVELLQDVEEPLSDKWKTRYEYALKNS